MSDKLRTGYRLRNRLVVSCALSLLVAAHQAGARDESALLDARAVLGEIARAEPESGPVVATENTLLADIKRFRTTAATLEPEVAAATWLGLYDRALKSTASPSKGNAEFDTDLKEPFGVASVIAALPAPPAWPALVAAAKKRPSDAEGDYRPRALELLGDVLLGDRQAVDTQLQLIDSAIRTLQPASRLVPREQVAEIRGTLVKLYGSPSEIAASFVDDLRTRADGSTSDSGGAEPFEVPDLVTLVGASEAERILTAALAGNVPLQVESGDSTRQLARRLALQNIASLKVPQWGLVDSIDAAPLYEALRARFPASAVAHESDDGDEYPGGSAKTQADTYYLLALIVAGRHDEARAMLKSTLASRPFDVPKAALQALQAADRSQALYSFLQDVLSHDPQVQAWELYIQQAAYAGHSQDALKVLETALGRLNLPAYLRMELRQKRAEALLALDDTTAALKAYGEILREPAAATDKFLSERVQAALRQAALGRVLQRPEAATNGLRFVRAALALPPDAGSFPNRSTVLSEWFAEARKQHHEAQAQQVAIAELKRPHSAADGREIMGLPGLQPERQAALVELASLYSAANRTADVRILLDESVGWGARDLADMLRVKDSQGVPLTLIAARALSADQPEQAVRLATATIATFPGYDGAYELESSIDPHASEVFATQFKRDQFEERPLIWSAVILERNGQHDAAEKSVRAAITIDPSDGEEGENDRMRAYAVLADILEAKADAKGAADYRSAVAAIRISERSDELYRLGLYTRAFAGYREALGRFSDAYCIQSRLAVQLDRLGQHEQAAQHYRRAYELMPTSFGRVESHCFGCESVFNGNQPQSIATQVFESLVRRNPRNPQVHYLQGYLLEEQGRYAEAIPAFRQAVQIDDSYLNAWKHLNELSAHVHLDTADRNAVTLKLLELDPEQRHVTYDIATAGDFARLWYTVAKLNDSHPWQVPERSIYPLRQSAAVYDGKQSAMPAELRAQLQRYETIAWEAGQGRKLAAPAVTLGKHELLRQIAPLLGAGPRFEY